MPGILPLFLTFLTNSNKSNLRFIKLKMQKVQEFYGKIKAVNSQDLCKTGLVGVNQAEIALNILRKVAFQFYKFIENINIPSQDEQEQISEEDQLLYQLVQQVQLEIQRKEQVLVKAMKNSIAMLSKTKKKTSPIKTEGQKGQISSFKPNPTYLGTQFRKNQPEDLDLSLKVDEGRQNDNYLENLYTSRFGNEEQK